MTRSPRRTEPATRRPNQPSPPGVRSTGAELRPSGNAGRHVEPLTIRVIDYDIDDGRDNDTTYRLFSTLLDPNEAPAVELASAYAQRWEIEAAFDELKVHQRGPRTVLRSKSPDLVLQEVWGHLCCHFAIGGTAGTLVGSAAVTVYATVRHWSTSLPVGVLAGGIGLAVGVGAVGGLYPALRAARLSPAEALRST